MATLRADVDVETAVRLRKEGRSWESIGKLFGCSPRTVRERVEVAEPELVKPLLENRPDYQETNEKICWLFDAGVELDEIAAEFGLTRQAVISRLNRSGYSVTAEKKRDPTPAEIELRTAGIRANWGDDRWKQESRRQGGGYGRVVTPGADRYSERVDHLGRIDRPRWSA